MDESKLDWSRPFRDRDNKKPVFINKDEDTFVITYWSVGICNWAVVVRDEIPEWVENVPLIRKLDFWLNVYPGHIDDCTAPTKEAADANADSGRIDCVHIVYEYEVKE